MVSQDIRFFALFELLAASFFLYSPFQTIMSIISCKFGEFLKKLALHYDEGL